ncbi:EcsC family protein [Solicola sp. PLA-1-18]|uniref:EcsC family protein n=1 Tax=Solicola sp. PLA-1-18 TaxID=3380532 RepID=UPI003B7D57CF
MGIRQTVGRKIGEKAAPGITAGWVKSAFDKAIDGVGPIDPVRESAAAQLEEHDGDVEKAIAALVSSHARLAGAQGFLTNLGGVATMAFTVPANVSALAVLQCHLVAGIAHLRGYDVREPRVRDAVMASLLGPDSVKKLVAKKRLPGTPREIATGTAAVGSDTAVAKVVAGELVAQLTGGRTTTLLARKIPLMGGPVGAFTDTKGTREVGTYAKRELTAVS